MSDFKDSLSYANRSIAYLFSQVNQQNKLRKQVQALLPLALGKHAQSCRIKNETLIIYTDSAAWASQFRFHAKNIQQALNLRVKGNINSVQIKILATTVKQQIIPRHPKYPSFENIKQLKQTNNPDSGDKLEQALFKLSETLEKHKKNN